MALARTHLLAQSQLEAPPCKSGRKVGRSGVRGKTDGQPCGKPMMPGSMGQPHALDTHQALRKLGTMTGLM